MAFYFNFAWINSTVKTESCKKVFGKSKHYGRSEAQFFFKNIDKILNKKTKILNTVFLDPKVCFYNNIARQNTINKSYT